MEAETRILLTGGGTGGHIYPLIAVAEQLKGVRLRYFGYAGRYRELLLARGVETSKVLSSKLRRYFSFLNFLDFFRFFISVFQSLWKIYWFMPDAAFSKGGPGSLAVVLACRFYLIPVLVHESDAIPGLANKIAGRFSNKIDLAFDAAQQQFVSRAPIEVVGQPVRQEILQVESKEMASRVFSFDPLQPTILVLGGSQGSEPINEFILTGLSALLNKFQIIHQVGEDKYEEYKNTYEFIAKDWSPSLRQKYFYAPYFDEKIVSAYNASDLVVSRAGAGSIFEIAAKLKPAILIPFPEAANDHQRVNAFECQKAGSAIVIEQENLLPNLFISVVESVLKNEGQLSKMISAAKKIYRPDAAVKIARDILLLINSKHEAPNSK
ncbi:MAG: hypothetical protein A3I24_00470 [Candidatus Harrisonbacteria bacterium RIFCSPLOWO2_02_FULL_41_13b]|uniref:UDP-N-acetylglucosamine--N-acetylmuramyl-(pentapeptide) pyrophosphoryl-undecaprenol N-acetylglucosamine transferase n=1 Tax=Candidatus Harrisonbacteria bacterium RIFCSPLOWO2_02_FULL_41_13b TaxID=1798409 RepID=A0A1G1ZS56_9BACT|nr:MAG: hypothetical protein A3J53_00515 [Candidatus Harrisonbacteria bacterium RIFCSPHIGHO2_02_FULL_40_20]OGY67573.1 MAG: hypothetical protein A3I24_00470 [Candidatus Harrisonbacteria bacterium RIFCSPLOWO2_02_FULL_41_13b]